MNSLTPARTQSDTPGDPAENSHAGNSSAEKDDGSYRVIYTETGDTYTRRHGTEALSRQEAEEACRTIESLQGYENVHLQSCPAGDGGFSDPAITREEALPRVAFDPFINEEGEPANRLVGSEEAKNHPIFGVVWIHVIVEYIDEETTKPDAGPTRTLRVLAGVATPEQVMQEDFAETLRSRGTRLLRKSADRLERKSQCEGEPESARLLRGAADALPEARLDEVGVGFHSRVVELGKVAAAIRETHGLDPVHPFENEDASR